MKRQTGFTLIELMVSVTILAIISGTVYTAFNSSLNVYQRESGRVIMHQKCRVAVDQIARDLSNLFYIQGDEDLQFQAEDVSQETGEQDTITFVLVTDNSPDPFLAQLYPQEEDPAIDEEATQATSDLTRVVYMLGTDPELTEEQLSERGSTDEEEQQSLSLLRITSRSLNLEELMEGFDEGIESLVESERAALEAGETPETQTQVVADHVVSLDFKFFDGEEWIEAWEEEEILPRAVQVIITVADEQDPSRQVIQSTMSYLKMVPEDQEEQAGNAGNQGGGPQGGGPG